MTRIVSAKWCWIWQRPEVFSTEGHPSNALKYRCVCVAFRLTGAASKILVSQHSDPFSEENVVIYTMVTAATIALSAQGISTEVPSTEAKELPVGPPSIEQVLPTPEAVVTAGGALTAQAVSTISSGASSAFLGPAFCAVFEDLC